MLTQRRRLRQPLLYGLRAVRAPPRGGAGESRVWAGCDSAYASSAQPGGAVWSSRVASWRRAPSAARLLAAVRSRNVPVPMGHPVARFQTRRPAGGTRLAVTLSPLWLSARALKKDRQPLERRARLPRPDWRGLTAPPAPPNGPTATSRKPRRSRRRDTRHRSLDAVALHLCPEFASLPRDGRSWPVVHGTLHP